MRNSKVGMGRLWHRSMAGRHGIQAEKRRQFVLSAPGVGLAEFDQGVGDLFVARVAGNTVNEDILGSLEYASKVAGSRLVVS